MFRVLQLITDFRVHDSETMIVIASKASKSDSNVVILSLSENKSFALSVSQSLNLGKKHC